MSEHLPYQCWREIRRQLDIAVEDMHHIVQAKPQNKTVLEDVIQRWLSGKNENEAMLYRVSFRKIGKRGQNDIYEKNGGGKGSARDSAPARGVWGHAPPKIF